jgi:type III restriction enzyme
LRCRPDFIFWGRKGDSYTILFVDPKGMEQIDWERKVDGYRRLFENEHGKVKSIMHASVDVTVRLTLFTRDRNVCPEGTYKRFWADSIGPLFTDAFRTLNE